MSLSRLPGASACGALACPAYFTPANAIVTFTAPAAASYRIEAWGGSGGAGGQGSNTSGGFAADVAGTFSLPKGYQLKILVGSAGAQGTSGASGGSVGGGTFVVGPTMAVLLAAGGGGGGSFESDGSSASLAATG